MNTHSSEHSLSASKHSSEHSLSAISHFPFSTGEVVGFVNLGEINNDLLRLENSICHQHKQCQPNAIATHLLVILVRGIFIKLNFPYAHFATEGITADILFPIVWEAVRQIEWLGLKIIFVTADGASPNRKFFRMHGDESSETPVAYRTLNRYAEDRRYLYFFSDPCTSSFEDYTQLLVPLRLEWNTFNDGELLFRIKLMFPLFTTEKRSVHYLEASEGSI